MKGQELLQENGKTAFELLYSLQSILNSFWISLSSACFGMLSSMALFLSYHFKWVVRTLKESSFELLFQRSYQDTEENSENRFSI